MGLLDWLTEGLGASGGSSMPPLPVADNLPTQPLTPVQQTGADMPLPPGGDPMTAGGPSPTGPGPGLPFAPGTDPMTAGGPPPFPPGADPMTAGGTPGNGPGLPYAPGGDPMTAGGWAPPSPPSPPLPAPKPSIAGPAAIPPSAAPTGGAGMPPGVSPPSGPPADVPGQTWLGRALGIQPGQAGGIGREFASSLGKGFTAAAAGAHLPKGAAFMAGAGGALTGGEEARNHQDSIKDKYLARAIAFANAGNVGAANQALTELRKVQAKAIQDGTYGVGKAGVANSQEQLYLRAEHATNEQMKAEAATLKQMEKEYGVDSPQSKLARTAFEKKRQEIRDSHLSTLGIDPKSIKGITEKPGFTEQNPYKAFPKDPAAAQKAFDALPDGAYFTNPGTNEIRVKRAKPPGPGAAMTPQVADPAQLAGAETTPAETETEG